MGINHISPGVFITDSINGMHKMGNTILDINLPNNNKLLVNVNDFKSKEYILINNKGFNNGKFIIVKN